MPYIDPSSVIEKLESMGAKKILLQLPDGLKPHVFQYFSKLSERFSVIVSSQPFYGACDIGNMEVYSGVDCIVQLGHSAIPNIGYPKPVIFEEYRYSPASLPEPELFEPIRERGFRRIGLLASVQYLDFLPGVREVLEKSGFATAIGNPDSRMRHPGQVLGCNFSAAHSISGEVDCFLIISTGRFHSIGVQLSTDLDTFLLDVNEMKLHSMSGEKERFLRSRYAVLSRARDAKKFCVVMDTKIGQKRTSLANLIAGKVKEMGGQAVMVSADDIRPSDFENMQCDAVVFTGCPRVPIDDWEKFSMPIMTPPEFLQIYGFKQQSGYVMDEIVAVD
jgi:2-(3-amino-3-carboxypropyl)histidine synthase